MPLSIHNCIEPVGLRPEKGISVNFSDNPGSTSATGSSTNTPNNSSSSNPGVANTQQGSVANTHNSTSRRGVSRLTLQEVQFRTHTSISNIEEIQKNRKDLKN